MDSFYPKAEREWRGGGDGGCYEKTVMACVILLLSDLSCRRACITRCVRTFRGTAILYRQLDFISQYASAWPREPSGVSDAPTTVQKHFRVRRSHTFAPAPLLIFHVCTRPGYLCQTAPPTFFFLSAHPFTPRGRLPAALFRLRIDTEFSRRTRFAALSKSFEINAKHAGYTRNRVGLD